jgi:hypothetical protein
MQAVDATEIITELGLAYLHHQGGGTEVSSRNAVNSEVPGGVLSVHGWSFVPFPFGNLLKAFHR